MTDERLPDDAELTAQQQMARSWLESVTDYQSAGFTRSEAFELAKVQADNYFALYYEQVFKAMPE